MTMPHSMRDFCRDRRFETGGGLSLTSRVVGGSDTRSTVLGAPNDQTGDLAAVSFRELARGVIGYDVTFDSARVTNPLNWDELTAG
jgi:hypothetical protein